MHDGIQWAVNMHIVAHIVFDKRKSLVTEQMSDVLNPSGEKVVHAGHGMSGLQQHIGKMTSEKSGSACNENTHTTTLLILCSRRKCHAIYPVSYTHLTLPT